MLEQPLPNTADNLLDPVIVQVRTTESVTAVHIFNTGEEVAKRRYMLRDLDLPTPAVVRDALTGDVWAEAKNDIMLTLQPHESVWLLIQPTLFGK